MREQVELLAELQEKDQMVEKLRRQVQQGPERVREIERQVKTYQEELEAHKGQLEEILRIQRQYESELEDAAVRIARSKDRLLTIKTNKEYQALLKEIEDADRSNAEKEEKILACMEEREKLSQLLRDKQKELMSERERVEKESKAIEAEINEARIRFSAGEKQRAEMAGIVDPGLLAKYEHLKARLGGVAVAVVENTTCSGCHVNIPPQMYNELQRRDSLKFCPNCQRIIYWKERDTGSADMSE